ncbi:cysteine desulfurase [Mucilaginibacter sp. RS28]|uniref:cysteine desulfurase n=1 Tax=Mucilaginibacter straminoryzae TaxID=2932774 RepID=A0A9X1X170_9SPHI|nr:cysteine desulfurase family protein [Mucilaginibacter straminoryzae]MCJ8209138.1 cysteine desulfurase [Mucilaginibacter straminoryzae]
MKVYLDNAATTPLDKEVFAAMTPYLLEYYGNPSSHHAHGRAARAAIEEARRTIAAHLNASPEEIIFTSGGTEADNTAIISAIYENGVKRVITTPFEHHAVLHTLQEQQKKGSIELEYIRHDERGNLDLDHLEHLLAEEKPTLVSVMHANNEVGNLNDIEQIGKLCKTYSALFHSDTVQTMGHYRFDLQKLNVDFLAASAHKFHGPKGVGFLFCRKGIKQARLLQGGGQERSLRAGTENIHGIIGLAKALEIACCHLDEHQQHVVKIKESLIGQLTQLFPDVSFNGNSGLLDRSLYTVLNVSLPASGVSLLGHLDEEGIAASGGSACSTGYRSHVLTALKADPSREHIRFSFSKYNTLTEIDYLVETLIALYQEIAA